MPRPRLYVFAASPFCEKAAWALDAAAIAHDLAAWSPGGHVLLARRLGAPGTSVPILVADGGTIQGSGRILDWTGLPGGDAAIEARADAGLGEEVRRLVYGSTVGRGMRAVPGWLLEDAPAWQRAVTKTGWPLMRRLLVRQLDATAAAVPEAIARLEEELAWVEELIGGRDHLVGGTFGRADIALASHLAPLARPEQHPIYRGVRLPADIERRLAGWSGRRALAWTRWVYAEHRHRKTPPSRRRLS